MSNLSLKFAFLVLLALLLTTCRGTSKDLVVHKPVGNYTLAWSNRDGVSPIVTVNGVALSGFDSMQRIYKPRVLQFPNETLYVFTGWCGAATQNSQLMLVRLSNQMLEEAVSVIGPTSLDDQFDHIEIEPIKKKGSMVGSLFNFYIDDDKVAVYKYLSSTKFVQDDYTKKGDKIDVYGYSPGYLIKVQPAASFGGIWYQRYTATREASIAEVIAAALDYNRLDPEIREVLAGVIVSGKSASGHEILYTVDEIRYTYGLNNKASIKLYIRSEGKDERGDDLGGICLVEISLSRRSDIFDYVIQNVTLTGIAG